MYKRNCESLSLFSSKVLQVHTAYRKHSLMSSMFFQEIKNRDSLIRELARHKIDNAFKAKPNQNQNVKSMFESNPSHNAISKSTKTLIERRAAIIFIIY